MSGNNQNTGDTVMKDQLAQLLDNNEIALPDPRVEVRESVGSLANVRLFLDKAKAENDIEEEYRKICERSKILDADLKQSRERVMEDEEIKTLVADIAATNKVSMSNYRSRQNIEFARKALSEAMDEAMADQVAAIAKFRADNPVTEAFAYFRDNDGLFTRDELGLVKGKRK